MNLTLTIRQSSLPIAISMLILSSCHQNSKQAPNGDGAYKVSAADTTMDAKAIVKKVDDMTTANKLNDAISFLTINLHRFKGIEKATLLNERGTAYYLKDDKEKAISDFLLANEIDPTNASYAMSIANTYESMESFSNAAFFAKKVLELETASDTDRLVAKHMIDRYESTHAGQ